MCERGKKKKKIKIDERKKEKENMFTIMPDTRSRKSNKLNTHSQWNPNTPMKSIDDSILY